MSGYMEAIDEFFKGRRDENKGTSHSGQNEFVVIGLGRFGASLARTLLEHGHNVLAIDGDMDIVQRRSHELPHVVHADATNRAAFIELGVENFDTGVVCIGSDFESNMLATVLLQQMGVRRVICKARTRTQRDILLKIGADEVILPEHEAGQHLGRRLATTGFVDYMQVNEDISVIEILAPEKMIGLALIDTKIRQRYGTVVVAIRRNEAVIVLPEATEVVQANDILVLIGRSKGCDQLLLENS